MAATVVSVVFRALRAVVFVLPSRTQPPKSGRGRVFVATWVRGSVFAGRQTTSKGGKNQSINVLRLRPGSADKRFVAPWLIYNDPRLRHGSPLFPVVIPSQPSPPPNRYKRLCITRNPLTHTTLYAFAPKRRLCKGRGDLYSLRRYEYDGHYTPNSLNVPRRKSGWRNQ